MVVVCIRLMISLIHFGVISGALIGNYQLYNSMGNYLHDFSSNSNYAQLVSHSCSGSDPKVTDRGTYLRECHTIKFPTTSLNDMAVAYWINVPTTGSGYIFSLVLSSQTYRIKYTPSSSQMELFEGSSAIEDENLNPSGWKFIEIILKSSGSGFRFKTDIRDSTGPDIVFNKKINSASFTGDKTIYINSDDASSSGASMYVNEVWWYDTNSVSSEFDSVYTETSTRQGSSCVSSPSVPCMGTSLESNKNSDNEYCSGACPCYSDPLSCISCNLTCSAGCYGFLSPQCVGCSSTCSSCDSTTLQCTCHASASLSGNSCVCASGYEASSSNPVICVLKAVCVDGEYVDAANTCQQCPTDCISCALTASSTLVCEECNSSFYIQPEGSAAYCDSTCPDSYYTDQSRNWSCQQCPTDCISCALTASSTLECEECNSSFYIQPEGSTGYCDSTCPDSYYTDQSGNWSCQPCISNCKTCTNSDDCEECISGNYFDGTLCRSCPSNCISCSSSSSCNICDSNFYLQPSDLNQICVRSCYDQYFSQTTGTLQCISCLDNCKSCSDASDCEECIEGYYLYTHESQYQCMKTCPNGYYQQDLPTKTCIQCEKSNCKSCSDASDCEECIEGYELIFNNCELCEPGTYFSNKKCELCPELCSLCNSSACSACVSSAILQGTSCICDLGKIQSSNSCITDPNLEPLSLAAAVISSDTILLKFDQKLLTALQSSDIYIIIDDITYTYQHFTLEQVSGSSSSYRIIFPDLNLNSSKIIQVNLSDPSAIISESGATIEQPSFTIKQTVEPSDTTKSSQSEYLAQDPQAEEINSKGSATTKAVTSGAAAMGLNVSTGLWNFINTLQLVSLIPMLNIDLPLTLFAALSALRGYSPIPNLFSYIIPQEGVKPYEKALLLGYETSQFLVNCGEMLSAFFISVGLYPILFFLKKIIAPRYSKSFIHAKLLAFLEDYHWNFFSRYFIESYIEIVLATFLQIIYAEDATNTNTANLYINLIFSLLALLLIFIMPGVIAYFIYKHRAELENEEFVKVWGSLFEEFSTDRGLGCYMYYIWFMARRLAISLCFVFLRCCPEVQVSLASVLSWMFFIYVAYFRPFTKRSINILNILIEFNIAACYTLVAFYLLDLSDSASDGLSWLIISLILISLVANVISMLYESIPEIVKLVRKCRRKNKANVQVLPEEMIKSEITKNETTYLGDDDAVRSSLRCLDISTIQRAENSIEGNHIEPYEHTEGNNTSDIDITKLYEDRLKEVSTTSDRSYIKY